MEDVDAFKFATPEERGREYVRRLIRDFNLTSEQAAGLVGNLLYESGGFKSLQEIRPVVEGSKGGFGVAQWTGPRRQAFETWCSAHGLDPQSDEANYGYLCEELRTTQSQTIVWLRKAKTLAAAVWSVGQTFERPGGTTPTNLPGYEDRVKWAHRVLAGASAALVPTDIKTQVPTSSPEICPADFIPPQMVGAAVEVLQRLLQLSGDYDGSIDRLWGPQSQAAILALQKRALK